MPLCQGCGASYDDNYKFCPHCGRAKPEPQAINLNVQVAPVRYEEAVLKIEVVGTVELTEPPFDYRPGGLRKALGGDGRNWTQIAILRLLLESMHPDTGTHLAFASGTFRGFIAPDIELPVALMAEFIQERFSPSREAHGWLLGLFDERRKRWDELNGYLVSEGWLGITQRATDREAPFADRVSNEFMGRDGKLMTNFQNALMATSYHSYLRTVGSRESTQNLIDFSNSYRYRRVAG